MAVIWKLEDMTTKEELEECDNRTCISKPQQWGKGGKREVNCSPVMTTSIVKPRHVSDGPGKRKRRIHSQFYDPRPVKARKIDSDSIVKLKKNLQEVNPKLPFSFMLPEDRKFPTANTLIVANVSVLHKQLQGFQMASTCCAPVSYLSPSPAMNGRSNESSHIPVPTQTNSNLTLIDGHFTNHSNNFTDSHPRQTSIEPECLTNSSPSQGFTNFPLLSNKCYEETVDLNLFSNAPNILNKVQVPLQATQELHTKTTGQANNNVWYGERKRRITVPKFGKSLKRKSQPTPEFIRAICDPVDISNLSFVKYGRENEDKVADMYAKKNA